MMALYFFHTEGVNRFHDLEGVELEESQLANQALEFLAESLRGKSREFWGSPNYRVVVTNEDDLIVYALEVAGFEAPAVRVRRQAWEEATPEPLR